MGGCVRAEVVLFILINYQSRIFSKSCLAQMKLQNNIAVCCVNSEPGFAKNLRHFNEFLSLSISPPKDSECRKLCEKLGTGKE